MARSLCHVADYDTPCIVVWPWCDRGRSRLELRRVAQEAETGKLLYLVAISAPDRRPTPLPTLQTAPRLD